MELSSDGWIAQPIADRVGAIGIRSLSMGNLKGGCKIPPFNTRRCSMKEKQTAISIISDIEMEKSTKTVYLKLAELFEEGRPDTLSMSPYELTDQFEGTKAYIWEDFLSMPEINRYIEVKLAHLMEFQARKTLARLAERGLEDGNQAVQASKILLEHSKLLQQNNKSKEIIVVTYVPPKEGME